MWGRQGGHCACLQLYFVALGRLLSALQMLGTETRDPDMLNIKAAGLNRGFGLGCKKRAGTLQ